MAALEKDQLSDGVLNSPGRMLLGESKHNLLLEIVRCAVCFEIPRENINLKIRICKMGHHFCSICYKKLKHCAICRTELSNGRNFAVEDLVNKLGQTLGLTKCRLPPPQGTVKLTPGIYRCLHQCTARLSAGKMLPHLRAIHPCNILENVRSNPYTERFDWMFEVTLAQHMFIPFSLQISDMGLFTIVMCTKENSLLGFLYVLGDHSVSSMFSYKLSLRIDAEKCLHEFSVNNCEIFTHDCDLDIINKSCNILRIHINHLLGLLNVGEPIKVFVSIFRKNHDMKNVESVKCMTIEPQFPIVFANDRNVRRNKQRNLRKIKLKKKLRENSERQELLNAFETLNLKLE